jgi:hypothetical protein
VWLEEKLPDENSGTITFEAKGTNDITVAFHTDDIICVGQDGRDESSSYEVVIGGWLNSKTCIRRKGQQQSYITKTDYPEGLITSNDFEKYWITVEASRISFGKGEAGEIEILRWKDRNALKNIRYVGFTSWHTPITIKNIKIIPPIIPEDRLAKKFTPVKTKTWFNNPILSDCRVALNGKEQPICAHRSVLYVFSHRWRDILAKQNENSVVDLGLENSELTNNVCFNTFVKFMYSGKLQLEDNNVPLEIMLKYAKYFDIKPLEDYLEKKLMSTKSNNTPFELKLLDFSSLFLNEKFSDLTFNFDDGTVLNGHKIVLAMQSDPFYAMFTNNMMRESSQRDITMHDTNSEAFKLMLEYFYKGTIEALETRDIEDEIIPLLMLADRYAVFPLRTFAVKALVRVLSPQNACYVLSVADFYKISALRQSAVKFIEQNFAKVSQAEDFDWISASNLSEIIFDDELIVENERQVYEAIMKWGANVNKESFMNGANITNADVAKKERVPSDDMNLPNLESPVDPDRASDLKQMLSYVRYPLMPKEYLIEIMKTNPIIKSTDYLVKLVVDALKVYGVSLNELESNSPPVVKTNSKIEAFRTKLRKSNQTKELIFSFDGDENGVFYWIATNGRTERWQNPHKSGKITVASSAPISRYTRPEMLVNRTYATISFVSGNEQAPARWSVDLGPNRSLTVSRYSMHICSNPNNEARVADWCLQGSHTNTDWEIIREHENESGAFTANVGKIVSWPVEFNPEHKPYRYLRVIVSGGSAQHQHNLPICGLEFYGYLNWY